MMSRQSTSLSEYPVWDRTTRWFHWINFLCVIVLLFLGTVILNAGDLGASNDGKILLKSTHVVVGYVFTINLLWRLVWGFIGGPYSRWKAVLPVGRGFIAALSSQLRDIRSGNSEPHAGHSPLGRIAVTVIFFFLLVQGATPNGLLVRIWTHKQSDLMRRRRSMSSHTMRCAHSENRSSAHTLPTIISCWR